MKRIYKLGLIFGAVVTCIVSSCSSTRLVSSWNAPDASLRGFNKVLVIGLMGDRDRNLRENTENVIVRRLQSYGINAGSAYAEYGPKAFEKLEEKAALSKLKEKGYDGAFTVALLDKSKEKRYTPGMMGIYPGPYRFWGYYNMMYTRIYEPGYYTVTNNFMLEANFYDLNADKLLYSGQARSVDPASPQSLATEFSDKIFNDMTQKGIIKQAE
ncbi:hypothetical protein [Pedobacter deserti]|uniref:hypothetical protein n=1 Tax=Pedobacter deserti TaxID=2817382 RepID=UPI00210E7571|nr:hypothetical protein [Pedobacter sp. SYSU D00382]